MARKRFYVTLELDVDLSSELEKPTKENLSKYRGYISDFLYSLKKKLNYSFYIQNHNVISIYDEKGIQI